MKARRQAEILAIIQEYDIETQDQLLESFDFFIIFSNNSFNYVIFNN